MKFETDKAKLNDLQTQESLKNQKPVNHQNGRIRSQESFFECPTCGLGYVPELEDGEIQG